MFEIWVLQQILISIFITVVLGGFFSVILGYRMSKKFLLNDEPILKRK